MTRPKETSYYQTLPLSTDLALRRRYMVVDEPIPGNLRFGLLLEILDLVAEKTALNYVNRFYPDARVVTAAIDNIFVRHAADVTRDIVFHARINHVGRSSLEIGIRVEQPGDPTNHIASCYFTMVARSGMGEGAVSVTLPPLEYLDETEQARAKKALSGRDEYRQQQALLTEPPSREEYEMLAALHKAQEEPGFSGLLAGRLVADAWERMYPEQENVPQKIFGGYLIRRAYELSAICSELVAPDRSIVAAVNRINFFHPVRMGDKLHFTSRVVYTSGSFVCVEASIERLSLDRTSKALSNSCLFTFVNVDRELVHQPVPAIYPATYVEDASYLAAHRSYQSIVRHHAII
ncbi:acyl-CoA thioesterase [Geotalea uraniireducens]|uniref:Thioesterase superfamily protein n=1 Tax=Geotalea uraniireducens (strain Rf4) TaxID=351605 RepID=A5GA57_GEOUR|nr:acyl-CoA thioesterase [Geotalea uraniireducens]ABQ25544.1 thioesterase superfamily protein [Geotalea uraniireducens Rf4]